MRRKIGRLMAFGLLLCLLAGIAPGLAESMHTEVENPSLTAEVLLGYNGRITYGKAFPVRVTVRNTGEDLDGTLAVNTYVNQEKYDRFETEISVPAGGERTVVLPVTAQTRQEIFTVEILRNGETVLAVNAQPEGVINPSAMMIGVLSSRPKNLANLDINQENDALYRYEYWQTVPLEPETLPAEKELLDSFGMIVLDDEDPASLTEKQQEALRDWVRRGHILILGGGATAPGNLMLAGELTSLRAGEFSVTDRVIPALENYLDLKSSGRTPEAAVNVPEGADPLIADENGNGLVWMESAGSGRICTLAWEAGNAALNTESILHTFFQQMLLREDSSLYSDLLYSSGGTSARFIPDEETQLTVRNPIPAAAAVIAGFALIACAAWLILRKYGKTQWMWAVLPALSLAAGGITVALAGGSSMNSPVAATAVNIVQDASGRMTRYTGVIAAAPRPGISSYSVENEKMEVLRYDDSYWDQEEDKAAAEPATLRVVYRKGAHNEIAVNAETPWESIRMLGERQEEETGRVEAEIWMESDGLHGTVTNGTSYALKEGAVVCLYGFTKIPALAPGESADFALVADTFKDPENPVFENGKMYMNVSSSTYQVASQMLLGTREEAADSRESSLIGMMTSSMDYLADYGRKDNGGQSRTVFVYCAEPETEICSPVFADGREIEGRSGIALLSVEMTYLKIGKTGVVFHTPGMDKAVRCEIDGAGMPVGDMNEDATKSSYVYYELSERPTFRFSPEGILDVDIGRMIIGMDEWYVKDLRCYALNLRLKSWVEVAANAPLKQPEQFLDENGNFWCQFRPTAAENYSTIPAPTLMVEGTLKNK